MESNIDSNVGDNIGRELFAMGKKNTERIRNDIIRDVRENLGVDLEDTSKDDMINRMSSNEIFKRWCEWNGLINYSKIIRDVIGNIYGIDIEKRVILK